MIYWKCLSRSMKVRITINKSLPNKCNYLPSSIIVFQLSISEGISVSDDSYIDSDYDASERSDGNSIITDSDVDHTTTPSNSSDNNVSFNENAYLRPVSDTSVQIFSSDSEVNLKKVTGKKIYLVTLKILIW